MHGKEKKKGKMVAYGLTGREKTKNIPESVLAKENEKKANRHHESGRTKKTEIKTAAP
jgi:hypothetical protein